MHAELPSNNNRHVQGILQPGFAVLPERPHLLSAYLKHWALCSYCEPHLSVADSSRISSGRPVGPKFEHVVGFPARPTRPLLLRSDAFDLDPVQFYYRRHLHSIVVNPPRPDLHR